MLVRLAPGFSLCLLLACGGSSPGSGDGDGDGDADAAADPTPPPFSECAGGDTTSPTDPLCLVDPDQPTDPPLAVFSQELVDYMGTPAVHITLVLNPTFVDNTYGTTAVGWDKHSFKDLTGSDHADIVMLDTTGAVIYDLSLDFISEDPGEPCGFGSLGPFGGEGNVRAGDETKILAWSSSLDENLNERGYCDYATDSPATDAMCTPNPDAPDWDFRVVYELWVAHDAFDPNGFGSAYMSDVHASPSKVGTNTVPVEPDDCCEHDIDTGSCDDGGGGGGGDCTTGDQCREDEFCFEGDCIPRVD